MRAFAALPALLLAGCIGTPAGLDAPAAALPLAEAVRALVGELPCDARVGEGTSDNVALLSEAGLDEAGYTGAGELWLQGDRAYVARYGSGGFTVVDIRDPLRPREAGAWDPEETKRGLDVKVLSDGSAALVGNDDGIRIVDVRDPRAMVEEHHEPFAKKQAHMLTVFRVAGQDYVAAAKGDGEDFPIFRLTGSPGAHSLERVASPALTTLPRATGQWSGEDLLRTHDASFYDDPLIGPTLWVANVWDGIVALDVSDPSQPREVARIPNTLVQYTHTVQTVVLEGEGGPQRITVSVSEVGANTMRVFDTTDLAAPRLLAEWHVPNAAQPQHNPQLVPPFLFVAHYIEGVFVFDLDALISGQDRPNPIARLASAGEAREFASPATSVFGAIGLFDGTWDVGVKDGLVYQTDGGLRVAAFGCMAPGDAAMRSWG